MYYSINTLLCWPGNLLKPDKYSLNDEQFLFFKPKSLNVDEIGLSLALSNSVWTIFDLFYNSAFFGIPPEYPPTESQLCAKCTFSLSTYTPILCSFRLCITRRLCVIMACVVNNVSAKSMTSLTPCQRSQQLHGRYFREYIREIVFAGSPGAQVDSFA